MEPTNYGHPLSWFRWPLLGSSSPYIDTVSIATMSFAAVSSEHFSKMLPSSFGRGDELRNARSADAFIACCIPPSRHSCHGVCQVRPRSPSWPGAQG